MVLFPHLDAQHVWHTLSKRLLSYIGTLKPDGCSAAMVHSGELAAAGQTLTSTVFLVFLAFTFIFVMKLGQPAIRGIEIVPNSKQEWLIEAAMAITI